MNRPRKRLFHAPSLKLEMVDLELLQHLPVHQFNLGMPVQTNIHLLESLWVNLLIKLTVEWGNRMQRQRAFWNPV